MSRRHASSRACLCQSRETVVRSIGSPAVHTGLTEDLYLSIHNFDGPSVGLLVLINPMVSWIWIATAIMALGGLVALVHQDVRHGLDEAGRPAHVAVRPEVDRPTPFGQRDGVQPPGRARVLGRGLAGVRVHHVQPPVVAGPPP